MSSLRSALLRKEALLAVAAAIFLLATLLIMYAISPTGLRVAVARDTPSSKLIEAWAESLERTNSGFRLVIVNVASAEEAAETLQSGRAELAVVRPEKLLPDRGMTIALLSVQAIVPIVFRGRGVDTIEELSGRRIGVLKRATDAVPTIERLARLVGWAKPPTIVQLSDDDLGNREALQKIDALLHIAPVAGGEFNALLKRLDQTLAGRPVDVIAVETAATLVQRDPSFEAVELEAGALSTKPKRPEEKSSTLGTSFRLMAHANLDRDTVYEVSRSLFEGRARLARTVPFSNEMTAPESSTSALLPIHPGTIDYIERDRQTFFSRYSDVIYIGASIIGGLVSAAAAFGQRLVRKRRERIDELLITLTKIMKDARAAGSVDELDRLAARVDAVVTSAVQATLHRTTTVNAMSAMVLTTDSVRHAIGDRRRELMRLEQRHGAPAPPSRAQGLRKP